MCSSCHGNTLDSQGLYWLAMYKPGEDHQCCLQPEVSLACGPCMRQLWLSCRGKEHQGAARVPAPAQSWVASGTGGCREVRRPANPHLSVQHPEGNVAPLAAQTGCQNVALLHQRWSSIDSPTPVMCAGAACRNWASGARWSGCIAAFRTYPEPNMDPLGYLKVGQGMGCMH